MAAEPAPASRAQSLLTFGALSLLLSATALGFGRVFTGGGASLRLAAAGVASAAVATAFERRNLLVATLASAVFFVLAISLLVFPQTTFWGVPTGRTFAAIGRAIGLVRQQARVQVSPTPALPPLFLAAVTAMWAAAFSAHALLVRAGSPILAMLPAVALVGFADTVLDDSGRPFFAVVFLLGVLATFLADSVRRLRLWGPIWQWEGRSGRSRSVPFRGATRVAVIAIGTAVLLPGLLPGFGAGPLVDLNSGNGETHIDPFVSIQATLLQKQPQTLFTVESPIQSYWRMLSLDRFDATHSTWDTSDPKVTDGSAIAEGALALPGEPAGGLPGTPTRSMGLVPPVTQTITVRSPMHEGETWLPMAFAPQGVSFPSSIRYDADLVTAFAPHAVDAGTRYTVTSEVSEPTRNDLEQVPPVAEWSSPPPARYVSLPSALPQYLDRLAHEIVEEAGATTPFDQALAIQNYLRSERFIYNLHADYSADPNSLVDFLTKTHAGMCQQFAGSMAVLVRELGLPARVAVGYRPGNVLDPAHPDVYTVTTEQLHAWVEVLLPGYGWIAFEPTKGISNPVADASYLSASTARCTARGCAGAAGANGGGKGQEKGIGGHQRKHNLGPKHASGGSVPVPTSEPRRGVPLRTLLRIAVLLGLLALVLTPPTRILTRVLRVRRARAARGAVLAEYRAFTERAADLGFHRSDGETIEEYGERIAANVRLSDGHLGRLSAAAERAAYGEAEPADADVRAVRSDAKVALRDIRRSVGLVRRIRGLYRPEL
ncbi:MAG: DUF3488 and DUF4129 domain-containing transglutaminase family protein [Actinomycetota bacterium]